MSLGYTGGQDYANLGQMILILSSYSIINRPLWTGEGGAVQVFAQVRTCYQVTCIHLAIAVYRYRVRRRLPRSGLSTFLGVYVSPGHAMNTPQRILTSFVGGFLAAVWLSEPLWIENDVVTPNYLGRSLRFESRRQYGASERGRVPLRASAVKEGQQPVRTRETQQCPKWTVSDNSLIPLALFKSDD